MYIVTEKGQVYDAPDHSIGDAEEGDRFLRDDTKISPPSMDDRYYGTLNYGTSDSRTGYVLVRKLHVIDQTVKVCS
jgi:hypothetical protein